MLRISEDVMTARLFDDTHRGFYVDVGAAHRDLLSVTRHFYDRGWSGVNVEPTFCFYPLVCDARPREINLLQSTPRGRENGVQWHTKLDEFGFNTRRR